MSYTISRTIKSVDELSNWRYVIVRVGAPTMEEVLAMDRVMRMHDAEIAAGKAMDEAAAESLGSSGGGR